MTPRQKELYDFICVYVGERGYAPTQQEMMDHLKIKSRAQIQAMLLKLQYFGVLERKPGWRGVRLFPQGDHLQSFHGHR